ncbi:non-haem dioxygenase in morphine synthesis N-terminal/2OG-Fe(II) oxygenase superfamily, putative [Angomonas deanei]|uniref:Non-haem dioxygenase in morphine synthesis N-terminal/2OG-Fe(II) oxygenase superfamily, putative n=1 Tax=Angomonas deanei TaxID=59799 RepID=A0A7G2CLA8_9TRYP|nr:non-haem dioxygenase in morphine synthesis N-terminal/2OG-Fe(II) oxygenase superfamily, putative [Angomonas deanei]
MTTTGISGEHNLPIINLAELDNESTKAHFYTQLRHLAKDIGFFYVLGHGINENDREAFLNASKKFFALPQDEKEQISIEHSKHFRGYTKTGDELTRNKPDYREQIDIGEELPALEVGEKDDIWLNLIGPNQWPKKVPEMKEAALRYQSQVRAASVKLLHAFMVALGVPEDSLDELITGVPQSYVKVVHYPANNDPKNADKLQGVGPHKDIGILTMLWQDNSGGLQVLKKDGTWIDAPPVKGTYIINIGESLELATNGYLQANIHQVVRPPESARSSRYSIPFFLTTNVRAKKIPLVPLSEELKAQAQGPSSDPLNPLFDDVGKNLIKARLRSHLAVTKRFYPKEYAELVAAGHTTNSAY